MRLLELLLARQPLQVDKRMEEEGPSTWLLYKVSVSLNAKSTSKAADPVQHPRLAASLDRLQRPPLPKIQDLFHV